jgi:hypothetical protein
MVSPSLLPRLDTNHAVIMLSANQFDHTPKASGRVLEVWANVKARSHNMERLKDFAVSEEPLLAVQEMHEGGGNSFPYVGAALDVCLVKSLLCLSCLVRSC